MPWLDPTALRLRAKALTRSSAAPPQPCSSRSVHWSAAVAALTVLRVPASVGAGLLPVQYSDPVTATPDTVIAAGAVAVLPDT